jgi:hypothetical protein
VRRKSSSSAAVQGTATEADVAVLMGRMAEANLCCERLHKSRRFDLHHGSFEVYRTLAVVMVNEQTGNRWVLSHNDFLARLAAMKELISRMPMAALRSPNKRRLSKRKTADAADAVATASASAPVSAFEHTAGFEDLGSSIGVFLEGLGYNIPINETVGITSDMGLPVCNLRMSVQPCSEVGAGGPCSATLWLRFSFEVVCHCTRFP